MSVQSKFNRFFYLFIFTALISITSCGSDDEVIDEVIEEPMEEGLFINEVFASGEDWVELYNTLEINTDIGGYTLSDGGSEYMLPSGTAIAAKGFLVIFCNDLGTGLNTNFKLSSGGESVSMKNADGILIDEVEFPSLDNGQSYARFPDGSDTWEISGTTTQGESNGGENTPAINTISHLPLVPELNEDVVVTAELISINDVASVKLYYRLNSASFSLVEMSFESGISYNGTIPGMATEGTVEYYVEAVGTNGESSFKPASAPDNTADYLLNTDVLPQLVINEFMALNTSCCPNTDGDEDEYDDWIEIYNAGTTSVDIAGMYLSDSQNDPFGDKISTDDANATTIPAGGYLLLWADGSTDQGPLHLNFSLSADGEDVGLFYIDGRTIDTYTFSKQSENVSLGRATDGDDTWQTFSTPTPGLSNN